MDDFDGGKSNGIGLEVKPPYTPRTASLIKYLACESKLYPELLQMSISEKVNLVEGAGLTLNAEDDTQLLQAVKVFAAGIVLQQGVFTTNTSGTDASMSTATLTLPAGRRWTSIRIHHTASLSSSNQARFLRVEANTTNQPGVTNAPVGIQYGTGNSDDVTTVNHSYEYIPTAPLSNQAIVTFWDWSIVAGHIALSAMYAVGHHAKI